MFYDQASYAVRCEWGLQGVEALAPLSDVVVIVDVLSFSTCVDIATTRGAVIFPYPWRDDSADAYAQAKNALLASKRRHFEGDFSLSPSSLLDIPPHTRLVLPSPNGSTLTRTAAIHAKTLTGCLRNCEAVARLAQSQGETITVIACGERWHRDHSLRPALEDWLGAGSIIRCLSGTKSPEAQAAVAVFNGAQGHLEPLVKSCASGRELLERGFEHDVELAAQVNVSSGAPLLADDAYVCQRPSV